MVISTAAGNRSRRVNEHPNALSGHGMALFDLDSEALPFNTTSSAD